MFKGREYLISDLKYLKLNISFPYEEAYNEIVNLKNKFVEYRSTYKTQGWASLPIVGKSSTEPYAWNVYGYKDAREAAPDMQWTEIADLCPVTTKWLQEVYPSNSYARTRVMLLEAGGVIEPHKDTEHSVLGAVNIAITNPKDCVWKWQDGETLEFKPGDVYAMNLGYVHSVVNPSQEDRYHLIIHHYDSTPKYLKLLKRSLKEQNAKGRFHYSTELF
jgi:quercetin dioxygenase-like cupin family protein|tara:strand:- start:1982 stop:2635 length:654 start_codon:yes stop_codon:yes gene_type:complete